MTAEPIQIADAAAQRKAFRRDGMGYVYVPNDDDGNPTGLELRADYLSDRSGETHAEMTVTRNGRHLHLARFNLTSTTSRGSLSKALSERTEGIIDIKQWTRLVEQFSVAILRKEREGEPTRYAAPAARRSLTYLIEHLVIKGKSNMLFAPGGSGKGYLSIGICCAIAACVGLGDLTVMEGRPFYFDWEDDFETFEDRLNRVARGMEVDLPHLPYRRMRGLATERINEMARAMTQEGATMGVIDSFSAAGGSASERTPWDTVAHRLFDALDLIPNVTWLIIDHVGGDKLSEPAGKAFGSIQKMNRVRNAWEMRSDQEAGSPTVHMKLFDAKWNHTGKRKPMGMRLEFEGDAVTFASEDPSRTADGPLVSAGTRMAIQLAAGALRTADLARTCQISEATVRGELRRSPERFRRTEDGLVRLISQPDEDTTMRPGSDLPW